LKNGWFNGRTNLWKEATWELKTAVLEHFPTFDLEDKIPFDIGNNVTIENETGQEAKGMGQLLVGLAQIKGENKRLMRVNIAKSGNHHVRRSCQLGWKTITPTRFHFNKLLFS
jgi:hypothetical protein